MHRIKFFVHTLAHLVNDSYGGFLAPLLPLLAAQHGLSLATAGLLVSVQTITASLAQPLWASVTDRFPNRWFIIIGVLIAGIFFSLIGVAPSLPWLAATILVGGMGIACFHPMATALAASLSHNRKGMAVAFFITGGTAGYALGPVFISFLVAAYGLGATPMAVIPGVIVVLLWFFLGPQDISGITPQKATGGSAASATIVPYRAISILTSISIIRAFVLMTIASFISFHLEDLGIELKERSYYLFALQFGGAMGGLFYGGLSDRFGRWKVMFWSPLAAGPLLFGFLSTSGLLSMSLLFLAGSLIFASAPAVVVSAQKMMIGREGMASALQIGFAWGTAGLSMSLVGRLAEVFGIVQILFAVATLPLLMSLLALLIHRYRLQFEA